MNSSARSAASSAARMAASTAASSLRAALLALADGGDDRLGGGLGLARQPVGEYEVPRRCRRVAAAAASRFGSRGGQLILPGRSRSARGHRGPRLASEVRVGALASAASRSRPRLLEGGALALDRVRAALPAWARASCDAFAPRARRAAVAAVEGGAAVGDARAGDSSMPLAAPRLTLPCTACDDPDASARSTASAGLDGRQPRSSLRHAALRARRSTSGARRSRSRSSWKRAVCSSTSSCALSQRATISVSICSRSGAGVRDRRRRAAGGGGRRPGAPPCAAASAAPNGCGGLGAELGLHEAELLGVVPQQLVGLDQHGVRTLGEAAQAAARARGPPPRPPVRCTPRIQTRIHPPTPIARNGPGARRMKSEPAVIVGGSPASRPVSGSGRGLRLGVGRRSAAARPSAAPAMAAPQAPSAQVRLDAVGQDAVELRVARPRRAGRRPTARRAGRRSRRRAARRCRRGSSRRRRHRRSR